MNCSTSPRCTRWRPSVSCRRDLRGSRQASVARSSNGMLCGRRGDLRRARRATRTVAMIVRGPNKSRFSAFHVCCEGHKKGADMGQRVLFELDIDRLPAVAPKLRDHAVPRHQGLLRGAGFFGRGLDARGLQGLSRQGSRQVDADREERGRRGELRRLGPTCHAGRWVRCGPPAEQGRLDSLGLVPVYLDAPRARRFRSQISTPVTVSTVISNPSRHTSH